MPATDHRYKASGAKQTLPFRPARPLDAGPIGEPHAPPYFFCRNQCRLTSVYRLQTALRSRDKAIDEDRLTPLRLESLR
jgi:hypothetical protein